MWVTNTGLIMTGVSLANFLSEPRQLFDAKVSTAAIVLRDRHARLLAQGIAFDHGTAPGGGEQ